MEFLAAAIQYNCIPLKKEENLAVLTRMIRDEANQVAKLIVLPEMCTTGYYFFHRDAAAAMAEEITGGETVGHLVQLCAQHGCYIAAGLMEREGEILYNSAVLIGPESFIGKHRKLHFFCARWPLGPGGRSPHHGLRDPHRENCHADLYGHQLSGGRPDRQAAGG